MPTIQELFLVSDWDEPDQAIQAREQRAAQLQAQGMVCTLETLYRVDTGRPVLSLVATDAEPIEVVLEDANPTKKRLADVKPKSENVKPRRAETNPRHSKHLYRQVELK